MKTSILKQSNLFVLIIIFVFSTIAVNAQVAINSTSTAADPSAMLDVSSTNTGVLIPRMSMSSVPVTPALGLLVYITAGGSSGNGFYYYNGTLWQRLSDGSGVLAVTAGGTGTGVPFPPGSVVFTDAASNYWHNPVFVWDNPNQKLGLGIPTPFTNLHIYEMNGDLTPASLIEQDNSINGTFGDAAMQYKLTLVDGTVTNITTGIDEDDNSNFEISDAPTLTGTTYIDPSTMLRIHMKGGSVGITDINHQSRARVYLGSLQAIPYTVWTGVEFDNLSYDEHIEFMLGSSGTPAQFMAKEEGYYQVNARTEFDTDQLEFVNTYGYVSIAIAKNQALHSIGNNLQIDGWGSIIPGDAHILKKNNAPNVSDVVYLLAGEIIEIWVWQDFVGPNANILPNSEITYVSIHKIS